MKNLILTLIVLLAMTVTVSAKSNVDSLLSARNYVIQEMLYYGFRVDKSNTTTTLLTHAKGPSDFIYQVVITVKKKKLVIDGYITSPTGIKTAYIKEPWKAIEHLEALWNVGIDKYKNKIKTTHNHQLLLHEWVVIRNGLKYKTL